MLTYQRWWILSAAGLHFTLRQSIRINPSKITLCLMNSSWNDCHILPLLKSSCWHMQLLSHTFVGIPWNSVLCRFSFLSSRRGVAKKPWKGTETPPGCDPWGKHIMAAQALQHFVLCIEASLGCAGKNNTSQMSYWSDVQMTHDDNHFGSCPFYQTMPAVSGCLRLSQAVSDSKHRFFLSRAWLVRLSRASATKRPMPGSGSA